MSILSLKDKCLGRACSRKQHLMRTICNISEPQGGKTSYTLKETENCLEFVNLNLIFQYNIVLQDLLQKAKNYNFSCEEITREKMNKFRGKLIKGEEPEIPTMLVGIMDVYRAEYMEGFLLWMQENNRPVRGIVDEYDIYQLGYTRRQNVARDRWLNLSIKYMWWEIFEVNSATNINGVISDMEWDEVNVIEPYPGYCGWDTLQIQDLSDNHFNDFLNGDITPELNRKLKRAWDCKDNLLINISHLTDAHSALARTLENNPYYSKTKLINYKSDTTIEDLQGDNYCAIGGESFGRSISIPNLTNMIYYRQDTPHISSALQAAGRVLGKHEVDPVLVTSTPIRRSLESGILLERRIRDEEILLFPPEERHAWFKDATKDLKDIKKLFSVKDNGFIESNKASYQVTSDIDGYIMADRHHEIEMSLDLWEGWEDENQSQTVGRRFNEIVLEELPFLKKVKPVIDRNDGSERTWVAIKHHQSHHRRYVLSKHNYRHYPYMIGRVPNKPGVGYCIEKITDYGDNTYHHDEDGSTVRLISKSINREPLH